MVPKGKKLELKTTNSLILMVINMLAFHMSAYMGDRLYVIDTINGRVLAYKDQIIGP